MSLSKEEIKHHILLEGYSSFSGTDKTVERLFALKGEPKEMLEAWIKFNISPSFKIDDELNSDMLYQRLDFKKPAVILAYDMLLRFPDSKKFYLNLLTKNMIYKPQYN